MATTRARPDARAARLVVILLVVVSVCVVLGGATLGSVVVWLEASYACDPDGVSDRTCRATTALPWTNLGLQSLVLVAGLLVGRALRLRTRSTAARIGVTVGVLVVMAVVSFAVVQVLADIALP